MENSINAHFERAVHNLRGIDKDDTILFVLRHAQSLGQKDRDAYKTIGDKHLPLTAFGIEQARAAGVLLSRIIEGAALQDVQLISSTGHRSTRTAIEIFNNLQSDTYIDFDDRLDKQKFGKFDGLFTSAERRAACPQEYPEFERDLETRGVFFARPPEGESIQDVQMRMVPFVREREARRGVTIAITHGTNALCLEAILLHRGVEWVTERIDTRENCAIRMIAGNAEHGYRATTVCVNPVTFLNKLGKPAVSAPPSFQNLPS